MTKLFIGLLLFIHSAFAATATFTFTGTATGTLAGVPFTNVPFTVSSPGDFSTVTCSAGTCRLNVAAGATTFTLSGVGSGTFTGTTYLFVAQTVTLSGNNPPGAIGFGTTSDLIQIWDSLISSSLFTTYNLQSFVGPIGPQAANTTAGNAAFSGSGVVTSAGALLVPTLTNISFVVTQASSPAPPPTPAPSSLILLGIGVMVLATWRYLSRRTAGA